MSDYEGRFDSGEPGVEAWALERADKAIDSLSSAFGATPQIPQLGGDLADIATDAFQFGQQGALFERLDVGVPVLVVESEATPVSIGDLAGSPSLADSRSQLVDLLESQAAWIRESAEGLGARYELAKPSEAQEIWLSGARRFIAQRLHGLGESLLHRERLGTARLTVITGTTGLTVTYGQAYEIKLNGGFYFGAPTTPVERSIPYGWYRLAFSGGKYRRRLAPGQVRIPEDVSVTYEMI